MENTSRWNGRETRGRTAKDVWERWFGLNKRGRRGVLGFELYFPQVKNACVTSRFAQYRLRTVGYFGRMTVILTTVSIFSRHVSTISWEMCLLDVEVHYFPRWYLSIRSMCRFETNFRLGVIFVKLFRITHKVLSLKLMKILMADPCGKIRVSMWDFYLYFW